MIEVKTSKLSDGEFNRGVFAKVDIAKGVLFHEAPVIPFPNEEHDEHIEKTMLADYVFEYGENHTALLLGYGMLFNHSYTPNAYHDLDFDNHVVNFYTYSDVKAGEELLINYNVDNDDPMWFDEKVDADEEEDEKE